MGSIVARAGAPARSGLRPAQPGNWPACATQAGGIVHAWPARRQVRPDGAPATPAGPKAQLGAGAGSLPLDPTPHRPSGVTQHI